MHYDISDILSFDNDFFTSFQTIADKFVPILSTSKYKNTSLTLLGLLSTATNIKLSIYDLAEASETHLYSIQLLNRVLIEHYLKFNYILVRFLKEKTDEVGQEYRKVSKINDILSYINATTISISIIDESNDDLILQELKEKYPELNISKKELYNITNQWKHRSIVKYLIENANYIKNEYLLKLVPEYSKLSSFVHGSTYAEEFYHSAYEENRLQEHIYKNITDVCIKTTHMNVSLMIAVLVIDDNFQDSMTLLVNKYKDLFNLVKR